MTSKKNPFSLHTVTPYLVVDDCAGLLSWTREVFGAVSRGEYTYRDDGTIRHAEALIGDSIIMLGEPESGSEPMPTMLYVYVNNCDGTISKALDSGATSMLEIFDTPRGDRLGGIRDPWGNVWLVVTHVGK